MKVSAARFWLGLSLFLLILTMLTLSAGCGGSGSAQQQAWDFDDPSQFSFSSEVISVSEGGDSLAELKKLPDDVLWTATYADPKPQQAPEYHQIDFDAQGNVVAVGSNTDMPLRPITGQLIVGKYDRNGQALPGWPKFYTDPVYRWNEGQDVAVGADGSINIAGYSIVDGRSRIFSMWRLDSNGNMLPGWPQYPAGSNAYGLGIIVDSNGDIVACGASGPTGHDQITVAKYHTDGTPLEGWPRNYQPVPGQGAFSYDLIQDKDGNLVVVGYTEPSGVDRNAVLLKLDGQGNVLPGWPKVWDGGPGSFDEYFAISQDESGDYCIVGTSQGTEDFGKLLVTRYDSEGEQLTSSGWPRIYESTGIRDYSPPDAWRGHVDSRGNIPAAFIVQADFPYVSTLKYTSNAAVFSGFPKDFVKADYFIGTRSCNVDDLDNIYTIGFSYLGRDEYSDHTTFIVKYPPASYSTAKPWVASIQGIDYTRLTSFGETMGPDNQGGVVYQLSPNGSDWFYYDGTRWGEASSPTEANTASEIDAHIGDFAAEAGAGTLQIKAFLVSDGEQMVQLDSASVGYE